MAKNITLDSPWNRIALAVADRVLFYDLKLRETQPRETQPKRDKPDKKPQGKEKVPSVPLSLAAIDITSEVTQTDRNPFVGLYFNIYKGVWSLNSPRLKVEHEAAIKSLRPGFDPRSNLQEQQDFEAVCRIKSTNSSLITQNIFLVSQWVPKRVVKAR